MYKIEFKNVQVRDVGYGLEVNNKSLSNIISTVIGTRVGDNVALRSDGLEEFSHNSCDIVVLINPHPTETQIEELIGNEKYFYSTVERLEADRLEQFNKKSKTTDTEE